MPDSWKNKVNETLLTLGKQSQYEELRNRAMAECEAYKRRLVEQKRTMIDRMKRDLRRPSESYGESESLDAIKNDLASSFKGQLSQLSEYLRSDKIDLREFMSSYKEFASLEHWPSVLVDVGSAEQVPEISGTFLASTSENLDVFGMLEVKIPPEQIVIQRIAEMSDVMGVYDPDVECAAPTPVSMAEPEEDIFDYVAMIWSDYLNSSSGISAPGKNVKICIIDTGIDPLNKSFSGKTIISENFTTDYDSQDYSGHGTHCGGLAAGIDLGRRLVRGVAPHATLLSAKVFPKDSGAPTKSTLAALGWAYKQKADIVSLSLGDSKVPQTTDGGSELSKACSRLAQLGVIMCVSAGNSGRKGGRTITRPGDARDVITVGAVDRTSRIADFSSRGPTSHEDLTGIKPSLVAPGVDIVSARASMLHFRGGDSVSSSGGLISMNGTSMACPIVAGAAAVLLSYVRAHDVEISSKEIVDVMYETARSLPGASVYEQGHGLVQVQEALKLIEDRYANGAAETRGTDRRRDKARAVMLDSPGHTDSYAARPSHDSPSISSSSTNKLECSACGKRILSKLSLGGTCEQADCEDIICSTCRRIRKVVYCRIHNREQGN